MSADRADPGSRLLLALSLLTARPRWSAAELAARLDVSPRTVRRDLARLGTLGYRVVGRPGPGGHYRLEPAERLPPLLFDEDEVVALVAGLRMAEERDTGDAAARALAKLTRALPPRLAALAAGAAEGSGAVRRDPPDLDPHVLSTVTRAGAEQRRLAFTYRADDGESWRCVDSVLCLHTRGRWYVLGHDLDRGDWRVFRLDRLSDPRSGQVTDRRPGPSKDLAAWLDSDFGRRASDTHR